MQKIGKEIKIGLAVIGVLVAAFGYILFRRLTRPEDLAAAPAAIAAPHTKSKTAAPSDKPTVVSATDTTRPADATGGASSSRSLFASPSRLQASETGDAGADPRGSFMPPANSEPAASNTAPAVNGTAAAPVSRFSRFGHHDDAPSAFKSATTIPASATETANGQPSKSPKAFAADGNHSMFTAGNSAPPAEPASDPFQHKSSIVNQGPTGRRNPTSVATAPSTGLVPADPVAPSQATLGDSKDGNPLRHSHDGLAHPASGTAPDAVASESPIGHSGSYVAASSFPTAPANPVSPRSTDPFSRTVPPPVTPNAISVPSAQQTPADPVSLAQPINAGNNGAHRPGQYIVQPNDNYWTVSEKVYGTGGYFKAIYEHNRRQHAQSDRLQVGDALDVPDVAVLQQSYPELCPKSAGIVESAPPASVGIPMQPGTRSYSVVQGDTLYEIARRQLGQASRWGEIYQLNHDQLGNDFGYLRPGTQLLIPSDGAATSIAREPTGGIQR